MNYDWILQPLMMYGSLAAGLMLNLYLFCSLKRETGAARKRASAKAETLEGAQADLERRTRELETWVGDFERGGAGVAPQELNLTRRAKALRMHRRGESAASIAAALGSPRNEIDLLFKVQRLLTRSQDRAA